MMIYCFDNPQKESSTLRSNLKRSMVCYDTSLSEFHRPNKEVCLQAVESYAVRHDLKITFVDAI